MMKKLFMFGMAASLLLAGCSNDETVSVAPQKAIGFSDAFVDNGVRSIEDPSVTTGTISAFDVYGFTKNGQIFDGTKVSKVTVNDAVKWTYSPLQYWVVGNTYTFAGIAPSGQTVNSEALSTDGAKIHMTVPFTNNGVTDLLHAAPASVEVTEAFLTNIQPVKMIFGHQLSKVKFSFANGMGTGYNVKVTDIKITNAYATGTLNIGETNSWSDQVTNTLTLEFGHAVASSATANTVGVIASGSEYESYYEKLMIPTPSTATYTVTFTAELLQGTVTMGTWNHTATIRNTELKLGYCYDFKVTLTPSNIDPDHQLQPIEFTVDSVTDWNTTEQDKTLM